MEPEIKMFCIVSRTSILFTDAKDKRFTCNICNTVVKSPQQKTEFKCFLAKMVDICRKIKKAKANYCETIFISQLILKKEVAQPGN